MTKIDWKARFKNRTFVVTFTTTVVAFGYQVASMFGIVPKISQDTVTNGIMLVVNALAALGILSDPTTAGVTDKEKEVEE